MATAGISPEDLAKIEDVSLTAIKLLSQGDPTEDDVALAARNLEEAANILWSKYATPRGHTPPQAFTPTIPNAQSKLFVELVVGIANDYLTAEDPRAANDVTERSIEVLLDAVNLLVGTTYHIPITRTLRTPFLDALNVLFGIYNMRIIRQLRPLSIQCSTCLQCYTTPGCPGYGNARKYIACIDM
jgi:hypothetical protein